MNPADSELVTLVEACRRLGLIRHDAPRRTQARVAGSLRARLASRERDTGIRVIADTVSPKSRCVTVSGIRAALPELSGEMRQEKAHARAMASLDERIDTRCLILTEPRFSAISELTDTLQAADRILRREQVDLARRVTDLEVAIGRDGPTCARKGE